MRDIDVKEVTRAVAECCIDSCNNLPEGGYEDRAGRGV